MMKLEYSPIVLEKLNLLKIQLSEQFDTQTAKRIITGIIREAGILKYHARIGIELSKTYGIDTEYRLIFSHHHYLIYRIESDKVIVVQIFHEKEDFIQTLFGISGRTQASIDYWGE